MLRKVSLGHMFGTLVESLAHGARIRRNSWMNRPRMNETGDR